MSEKQKRIINDQNEALKKAHRALAENGQKAADSLRAFAEAASEAVNKIEAGYPHCAARQLRELINDLNKEAPNDCH
ncbi:hypothetical protein [Marinobacterium stanieri]|uniref:hypothetical protein n=1 Tax=Marinobacterium stanieri TaxID=49186 RepID=UPI0002F0ECAC|nr:hypothetical protein [Marinobacterium stanieri]